MNSLAERDQLTLRINKELNRKIFLKAKQMGVSVNAYISMILTKEVNKQSDLPCATPDSMSVNDTV